MTARGGSGSEMVIGSSERRERTRKTRLYRKHPEPRARRLLKNYLKPDETRKPEFYLAGQDASEQCPPSGSSLPPLDMAGVYIMDKEMQELGTAAVRLLTIATSWTRITNEGAS